jgi:hypothetical protein
MRFDIVTKMLGWMLLASSAAMTFILILLAAMIFGREFWTNELAIMLVGIFFAFAALPQFVSGLVSLRYADIIRLYRTGDAALGQDVPTSHGAIRLGLAFCGVWLAGIVGLIGMGLPKSISTLAIAGVMIFLMAVAGPRRMAQWSRG